MPDPGGAWIVSTHTPQGEPAFLVLDIAAPRTMLSPRMVPGARPGEDAVVADLRIGRGHLGAVRVGIAAPEALPAPGGLPADGVIGLDAFAGRAVRIDAQRHQVVLDAPAPRWSSPLRVTPDGVVAAVQLVLIREPLLTATLPAVLDTRASRTWIEGPLPQGLDDQATTGIEASPIHARTDIPHPQRMQQQPTCHVWAFRTSLGGDTDARGRSLVWLDRDQPSVDGTIGRDVLARGVLWLDLAKEAIAWRVSRRRRPSPCPDPRRLALDTLPPGPSLARATLAWALRDLDAADQTVRALTASEPVPPAVWPLLARLAHARHEPARLQEALRAMPATALVSEDLLRLAVAVLPPDLALERAMDAVAATPAAPEAFVGLALAALRTDRPDVAADALRQARARADDPDAYLFERAWVADASGDADGALALMRRALDVTPSDPAVLRMRVVLAPPDDIESLRADLTRALDRTHPGTLAPHALLLGWDRVGDVLRRTDAALGMRQTPPCTRSPGDPAAELACDGWISAATGSLTEARRDRLRVLARSEHPLAAMAADALALDAPDTPDGAAWARAAAEHAPEDPVLAWIAARREAD